MAVAHNDDLKTGKGTHAQRYAVALRLAEQGDMEGALQHYGDLLQDADALDPVLLAQVHNDLGFIGFACGDTAAARRDFEKALAVDAFCKEAHENLRKLDELVNGALSDERVLGYLEGFYGSNPSAMDYIRVHLRRFTDTLNFLPKPAGDMRLLELGANTLFSPLLERFSGYRVAHGDYWQGHDKQRTISLNNTAGGDGFSMDVQNFDVEKDVFPFENASFDVVLACEIIEHLPNDPMHMLIECNRVLKPGGRIVITTPNITSYRSMHAILNGYPPYIYNKFSSNNGGRHVKEYAPREFDIMFPKAGFSVEQLETRNVWADAEPGVSYWARYRATHNILKSLGSPLKLRGEDIFVIGVKRGEPVERYPAEFYD